MRNSLNILLVFAFTACAPPETKITRLTPGVSVAPGEIVFGEVVPGVAIDRDIQILSSGRATLEIANISLESDAPGISISYDLPRDEAGQMVDVLELSPSDTLPVTVYFEPDDLAEYEGSLLIESNDEDQPTLSVPITGLGVVGPQPDISIDVDSIDFGTLSTGETATEYVLVNNIGDGPLEILGTSQAGSGAFSVLNNPVGQVVAPGGAATVLLTYTPDGGMTGHAGTITFLSNDPDEGEVSVAMVGGDGGPDTDYPVAVITGETEVNPPEMVMLDGGASTAPEDAEDDTLTYAWTIIDSPAHSNASLVGPAAPLTYLDIDVAGSYTVELVVRDVSGASSAPAQHTIRARPVEDLYIALTWDTHDSDVDLHVVPSGGIWFSDEDLSFCQTELTWGVGGTGSHSGDEEDGYGPETVNITDLAETAYHIGVHYFSDNGGMTTEASITIYMNGEPTETVSTTLVHNYFWTAGYIRIEGDEGLFVPDDSSPDASSTRECEAE
jgi:hypothetical protein